MSEVRTCIQSLQLPGFTLEKLKTPTGKVCELPLCIPAGEATHAAILPDNVEILICDRHAVGIVALGEYLQHGPIELEPL